jgi:hypothetical protein
MAALSLGNMVVALDLDGAAFIRNTGQARGALKTLGGDLDLSKRQAAGFAQEGLGAIATISPRVANALADIAARSTAGMQALQLLGKAAVGVGLFMAAMDLGQRIRDLATLGETAEAAADRMKQATEAETRFLQERSAAIKGLADLEQKRIAAEGELAAAQARRRGDEGGAALAVLQTKLNALDLEDKAERRRIIESVKNHEARAAQLVALEETTAARRLAIEADRARQVEANMQREIAKILEAEKAAADAAERVRTGGLRGAKGLGIEGGLFEGLEEVDQLANDVKAFTDRMEDLAKQKIPLRDLFVETEKGQRALDEKTKALTEKFREQPAVLDKLNKAMKGLEFGGLAHQLDDVVRGIRGLSEGGATVVDTLSGPEMQGARAGVQGLTADMANLFAWSEATRESLRHLGDELAG